MRKSIVSGIMAVTMAAMMLGGCSSGSKTEATAAGQTAEPANRLEEIKQRGYIEIATEPYFAPNEFIDSSKTGDEQYVGSDIELAKYIADKLGVELKIVPLEFAAVLSSITEGKYDLAISALAYTPERAEAMNMSKGYHFDEEETNYGILIREEDKDKYMDAASMADAVFAVQSGSIQEGLVNGQIPKMKELKRVSSMTDSFLMVSEKKADIAACDISNGELYASANPGLMVQPGFRFEQDLTTRGTRVGIPKGEDELTAVVDEAIDELTENGQYDKWYNEYSEYAKKLGV